MQNLKVYVYIIKSASDSGALFYLSNKPLSFNEQFLKFIITN